MTKTPIRGSVKTRLATQIGEQKALELYRCFLLDLETTLEQLKQDYIIYYTPSKKELQKLLGEQTYHKQVGANLGERLYNGLEITKKHGYSHAVALASDIPDITPNYLRKTLKALKKHDAVIGPSTDGGYNLIGLKASKNKKAIFTGVPWGTETVLDETLERLEGYSVHILPPWRDIDNITDLKNHNLHPESYTIKYLRDNKLV